MANNTEDVELNPSKSTPLGAEDVELTRTKIARVMLLKEYEHLSGDEMVATDTMHDLIQQEANRQKAKLLERLEEQTTDYMGVYYDKDGLPRNTLKLVNNVIPLSAIQKEKEKLND